MGYENYRGNTSVISGLIQENNRDFPIARACDIVMPDESRLDVYLENMGGGSGGSSNVNYTTQWDITLYPDLSKLPGIENPIMISFSSNGGNYKKIYKDGNALLYGGIIVYSRGSWNTGSYRFITINEKIEDIRLYEWLQENAHQGSGPIAESPVQPAYDPTLNTENKTVAGAINEINNIGVGGGGGTTTSDMPTIRFIGLKGERNLWYADDTYNHSIRFSIEIVDGALQVGDTLQACGMRTFSPSKANPYKKRKLRRFAERVITEDDLNQRFLVLTVNPTRNALAHLGHNNRQSGGPTTIYFRVRRPKGALQTNDTGMTVDAKFSNVVPVPMHYQIGTGFNSNGEEYDIIYVQPI